MSQFFNLGLDLLRFLGGHLSAPLAHFFHQLINLGLQTLLNKHKTISCIDKRLG